MLSVQCMAGVRHILRWSSSRGRLVRLVAAGSVATLVVALSTLVWATPAGATVSSGSGLYVFGSDGNDISTTSPYSWGPNSIKLWTDLEPTQGTYDWSSVDSVINSAQTAGKKVILRVYANADGFAQATPSWFFSLPGAESYQTSFAQSSGILLPVPSDPVFKTQFGNFLQAFGARYNGNPNIELVQSLVGGGLYGEQYMGDVLPAGWTSTIEETTSEYWADQWRAAFPNTNMTVMLNDLGGTLMPDVAAYAVGESYYLESNSPSLSTAMVDTYNEYDSQTKILLEIENGGCVDNTMPGFGNLINQIFGYGFSIDYLTFCGVAFSDPTTASYIHDTLIPMLRTDGPGGVAGGGSSTFGAAEVSGGAITVDGSLSEAVWDQGQSGLPYSLSRVISGTWNNTVQYSVLWDDTYLYVGVKVLDASLENDTSGIGGGNDDGVDVYVDGDHNKGSTYDSHDNQYQMEWNNSDLYVKQGDGAGVEHGWSAITGGYEFELAVPWSDLDVSPSASSVIGFDLGNNDDDNGGLRDGQAMAFGTTDNWENTSNFGDLTLD